MQSWSLMPLATSFYPMDTPPSGHPTPLVLVSNQHPWQNPTTSSSTLLPYVVELQNLETKVVSYVRMLRCHVIAMSTDNNKYQQITLTVTTRFLDGPFL